MVFGMVFSLSLSLSLSLMTQIWRQSTAANCKKGSRRSMTMCHVCTSMLMELNMKYSRMWLWCQYMRLWWNLSFKVEKVRTAWFFFCFWVSAVPETGGGETQEFEVYDFTGAGGVGITMYNTDEVHSFEFLFGLLHNTSWTKLKPS